ncbi:MAG: hypothetical protein K9J32_09245 [Synechococcus lacustris]|nr:hypothetical protein [Synechococcus lacustris]
MAEDIKKSFIFADELPPAGPGNTHSLRYRIVSDDGLQTSAWSPTYTVTGQIFSSLTGSLVAASTTTFQGTWDDEYNRPAYDVFVAFGIPVATRSISNNIVTITTSFAHGFSVGDLVVVANTGSANVNKVDAIITEIPNSIAIRYANTAANLVAGAANAGASVHGSDAGTLTQSNYIYHGSPSVHSYSFLAGPDVANSSYYTSAQVVVQVAGINKELDSTLQIFKSARVNKA